MSRPVWLSAAALVLAGSLTYANSLSGPFILDDHVSIVGNEQIRRPWPPSDVLFAARELSTAGRPVVNVSFALNYAAHGLEVGGYHVVNIAIHLCCALLLFGVVRRTLSLPPGVASGFPGLSNVEGSRTSLPQLGEQSTILALATALVWMVHPLQTEAVNYVTERTELLMACFYLLTLYASLRAHEQPAWAVAAVAACALGMGSKESMATAPLTIVLFDRIFVFESFRQAYRARWRLYGGLAATWMLLAALLWSGPRSSSTGFSAGVSPWTYLLNQTVLIVRYLWLSVWPQSLVIDYGVPQPLTIADVFPYAVLMVLLLAATLAALWRRPTLGFLGAWFFITLAPTSSILPIVTWVGAERRMYLPLAALAVLLSLAAIQGGARRSKVGLAVVLVLSAALAMGTVRRNREYRSAIALAETVLDRYPHPRAHTWLGEELIAEGRRDEGIAHLREAIAGDPRAHYALGTALFEDGKLDLAVAELEQFVRKQPLLLGVVSARETMGRALLRLGKLPEAEEQLRELLRMRPSHTDGHALLAETLFNAGRFEEAIGHYQEVLTVRPAFADVLTNVGISSIAIGRIDEAIGYFRRAVEIDPSGSAERNLARALLEKREYQEAAVHAERALELLGDDAVAYDALGVALAGQGRLDEAIGRFRQSLRLDSNDAEVREHLTAALRLRASLGPR